MTDTIIEPNTTINTDSGEHDMFSHYVLKEDHMNSIINGTPCIALCGKVWLPTRDGNKFPVCPECKEIYEQLPTLGG